MSDSPMDPQAAPAGEVGSGVQEIRVVAVAEFRDAPGREFIESLQQSVRWHLAAYGGRVIGATVTIHPD